MVGLEGNDCSVYSPACQMTEAPDWGSLSLRKLRSSSSDDQASPDTDLALVRLHCNYSPAPGGVGRPQHCLQLLLCPEPGVSGSVLLEIIPDRGVLSNISRLGGGSAGQQRVRYRTS